MKTHTVRRIGSTVLGVALLLLSAGTVSGQVVNNSFEQDGQFAAAGWQYTDPSCVDFVEDAPPGGGTWALKLQRRNLQGGCFGVAYQVIRQMPADAVWNVTAWVRVPAGAEGTARLYWTDFAPADTSGFLPYSPRPYGSMAISASSEWAALSVSIDSAQVAQADSVGIVLDTDVTTGPTAVDDFAFFDLVSLSSSSSQTILDREQPEAPAFSTASNYPNPFHTTTSISFTLNHPAFVSLEIFDLLGRKVDAMLGRNLVSGVHSVQWDAGGFSDGLYIARLQAGSHIETIRLVRMR